MPTKTKTKSEKALLADVTAEMDKTILTESAKKAMRGPYRRKSPEDFNQAAFRAVQETIRRSGG